MGKQAFAAAAALIALTGCGNDGSGETADASEPTVSPLVESWDLCAGAMRDSHGRLADDREILISGERPGGTLGARMVFDCIADTLDLPDSLEQKVDSTRPIDGRQEETYDNIRVSWTYHVTSDGQSFEAVFEPAS